MDIDDPFGVRPAAEVKERPADFQASSAFGVLNETFRDAGLRSGRIGMDTATVSVSAWEALRKANPGFEFIDVGADLFHLRARKTPWEVSCLRAAALSGQRALEKIVPQIRPGVTEADLVRAYRLAVDADPVCDKVGHAQILIGPNFAPTYLPTSIPAKRGGVIELDVGTEVLGYASDLARTFFLGEPVQAVKDIYAALRSGHDRLLETVAPGVPFSEVYRAATETVLKSGLRSYNRGHLGHSIGLDVRVEEPPVVGPKENDVLEPGMVLCVETPYYGFGIGGISIEDMVLVTDTGNENLITLGRDMRVI
jgi:Xaa-Pro aminopeptidase